MAKDRKAGRVKTRRRIRGTVIGNSERPRVAIFRSLKHLYLQAIDDESGRTLVSTSTLDKDLAKKVKQNGGGSVKAAELVGEDMAKRLKDKGLTTIVFDRGGFIFHGRVKAAADAMRKGGIQF